MKIAAILHLTASNTETVIEDKYIGMAIAIFDDLLNAQLTLYKDKGIIGKKAEYEAVLRKFKGNEAIKERQLVTNLYQVAPFKKMQSDRAIAIRVVLAEMVKLGLLILKVVEEKTQKTNKSVSVTTYTVGQ